MKERRAIRVLSAILRGSSWPVVLETDGGNVLTKLRGGGHGTLALVAEIVVAELAESLGLSTPERLLVHVPEELPSNDPHAELRDLLTRSVGLNLGFAMLAGARDLRADEIDRVPPDLQAQIVWLDALTLNLDRTSANPNLMLRGQEVWLIDHGAALAFHHDWRAVDEQTPREAGSIVASHLFRVPRALLERWDIILAPRLSRAAITAAVARVPDDFFRALSTSKQETVAAGSMKDTNALLREREAYVAFLWKRLKSPRPFVATAS